MKLVNLTPHAVTLHGIDGSVTLPPSGAIARLAVTRFPLTSVVIDGVTLEVNRPTMGAVSGLPDDNYPDVLYVVSALVAEAVRRRDLVSPGELLRDSAGVIIGAKGLCSYKPL